MLGKKVLYILLIVSFVLVGCQKVPENNYLGNLDLSYKLKGDKNQIDQDEFEFFYGYAFTKYLAQIQNALGKDNVNVLPFELTKGINSLRDQKCTIEGYSDKNWEEYFANEALKYYQEINGLYNEAIKNGIKENQDSRKEADNYYKQIEENCQKNNIQVDDYIHSLYGVGANKDLIIDKYKKIVIASLYSQKLIQQPSNEDIEKYYHENKNDFDTISIRYLAFEKNDSNQKLIQDNILKIQNQKDFKQFCINNVDLSLKTYYQESDISLRENLRQKDLPEYLQSYLFNNGMKENEVKMFEGENSYDIVMFIKRVKPVYHQVNISTIYLDARESDTSMPTDKQWQACRDFANELYNEIKKEKSISLDIFHSYNTKYSDYKTNNGDYYGVSKRDSNKEIEKWIYNLSRKEGDINILKSENGYTIIYYIGQGNVEYFANAKNSLEDRLYDKKLQTLKETINVSLDYENY